jgi:ABC-type branched-subunit amino acid transport system substrate-binding protein
MIGRRAVRHGIGPLLLAIAAMLQTGCGTTVSDRAAAAAAAAGSATADGSGTNGLSVSGSASGSLGPAANSAGSDGQTAATATGSAGSAGSPEPAALPAGARPAGGRIPAAAGVPGVTDRVIRVGAIYSDDADQANKAAGVPLTNGDLKHEYELLRDYINNHGGVAGRKIELELVNVSSTSSADPESTREAICNTFTHDHPVFAVIGAENDSFRNCIRKGGAVQVHNTVSAEDDTSLHRIPSFAYPHGISLSRVARIQPDQLAKLGYFTPGAKYGLVTFDDPSFVRAVKQNLEPAMARHGVKFTQEEFVTPADRLSDYSSESSAISSAVLKFRQEGITHVQFLQSTGDISLFFMRAAESQQYRPRYGLNGQDAAEGLVSGGLIPPAQVHNSVGFGWYPLFDVPMNEAQQSYTASTKQCLDIYKRGGMTFSDYNATIVALFQCDAFFFLQRAVSLMPVLSQAAFAAAIPHVSDTFVPASTFTATFAPGKTDGVSAVRPYKFFDNCSCYHYVGAKVPA